MGGIIRNGVRLAASGRQGIKASGDRHPSPWKAKTVITLPRELGKQLTFIVRLRYSCFKRLV